MNITLHSAFTRHPKFARLSDAAFRKWFALDGYCCEHLTDGVVPKCALRELGVTPKILAELLAVPPGYEFGLLEDQGDNLLVHDFGDWNDTKASVQAARRRLRERVRRCRDKRNGVTDDDSNGEGNPACNGVTNSVCTEGDSGHRPSDNEQISPQPPSRGEGGSARPVTRTERKWAEDTRRRAFGRCPHEPPCADYETCITALVLDRREQRAAAGRKATA